MDEAYVCLLLLLYVCAAAKAVDELNFTPLNNKPIRIMYSNRDPTTRKSGTGNIYIKVGEDIFEW